MTLFFEIATLGLLGLLLYRQRRIERTLAARHDRLRLLVRNMPVLLNAFDDNGRIVAWNKACEDLTGYKAHEVMAMENPLRRLYPDARYRADMAARIRKENSRLINFPCVMTAKDGRPVEVLWSDISADFPIPGWHAWAVGVVVAGCDADDCNQTPGLLEYRDRLEEILRYSRDILYRRDLATGRYDYVSHAFTRILGYSPEETEKMAVKGIADLIHPEDRESHDRHVRILSKTGDNCPEPFMEYRMRARDGRYRWFSDSDAIVSGPDGEPRYLVGANRDITSRKEMEAALNETQDRFVTVLDSIDAHIYVADMSTYEILFMNRKMKEDFGRDMTGLTCYKVFRNENVPCAHCTNDRLLQENGAPAGDGLAWEDVNPVT